MVTSVSERILRCSDTDDVDSEMDKLIGGLNTKAIQILAAVLSVAHAKENDPERKVKLRRAVEYIECEELLI